MYIIDQKRITEFIREHGEEELLRLIINAKHQAKIAANARRNALMVQVKAIFKRYKEAQILVPKTLESPIKEVGNDLEKNTIRGECELDKPDDKCKRLKEALERKPYFMKRYYGLEHITYNESWLNCIVNDYASLQEKSVQRKLQPCNHKSKKVNEKNIIYHLTHEILRRKLEALTNQPYWINGEPNPEIMTFENMVEIFFKPRHVKVYLLNGDLQTIASYEPEHQPAKTITPSVNYYIYKNGHIFPVDNSFRNHRAKKQAENQVQVRDSIQYPLSESKDILYRNVHLLNDCWLSL